LVGAFSLACATLVCVAAGTATTLGCVTDECNSAFECVYPKAMSSQSCSAPESQALTLAADQVYRDGDELVWYSAPFNGDWLTFPGNETLSVFYPPEIAAVLGPGMVPTAVDVWLSSDAADASSPFRNIVNGAGQLAEYVYMDNRAVNILNATCAPYSLRIEVRAAAGPGATDGAAFSVADAGEAGNAEPDALVGPASDAQLGLGSDALVGPVSIALDAMTDAGAE
jgi:hypothetical protein